MTRSWRGAPSSHSRFVRTLADVKGIHNWVVLENAEDYTEVSR
jgi:hypothetical protein